MHKDEIHHYALTGFIHAMPSAFPSFVQDAASVSCSESQLTVSCEVPKAPQAFTTIWEF